MKKNALNLFSLEKNLNSHLKALSPKSAKNSRARRLLMKKASGDTPIYGVNTGFGALATELIDSTSLKKLQENLLLSHAVGVGELLPKEITRLMLFLKLYSFHLGFSAVSDEVLSRLHLFLKKDLIPAVPAKGSLGASGDLAPLAHMALPLIAKGMFWDKNGTNTLKAQSVLNRENLKALKLKEKEGLALCNGTQLMSAYGVYILKRANELSKLADICSAMTLEAYRGSHVPFDKRLHELRPHPGQINSAFNLRKLLKGSEINRSHKDCKKVQDPYSLRCIPQVHGASRDGLSFASAVVNREINSATDNPLVFPNGDILSGGNFHGEPLAQALDFAAISLAELGSISERRSYLLLKGIDELPQLLVKDSGVNSGFMILHYSAAALVSENKILCHPASVDSIPTSLGQEDHVSMGALAGQKALSVLNNLIDILAIEALTAAQALDFRKPLKAGRGVMAAHRVIRRAVKHRDSDKLFEKDLETLRKLIRNGKIVNGVEKAVGALR